MILSSRKTCPWTERQENLSLFFAGAKIEEKNDEASLILSFRKRKRSCFETNLRSRFDLVEEENNSSSWPVECLQEIRIFVQTFPGDIATFTVQASNSILDLKIKIHNVKGLLPENQSLIFNGEALENERTFGFYNMRNESLIYLFLKSVFEASTQIFVNYCGRILTMNIKPSDTIEQIKHQIQEKTKIPLEYQILKHSGRILESKMNADFYKIQKESTIFLSTRILAKKFVFSQPR